MTVLCLCDVPCVTAHHAKICIAWQCLHTIKPILPFILSWSCMQDYVLCTRLSLLFNTARNKKYWAGCLERLAQRWEQQSNLHAQWWRETMWARLSTTCASDESWWWAHFRAARLPRQATRVVEPLRVSVSNNHNFTRAMPGLVWVWNRQCVGCGQC